MKLKMELVAISIQFADLQISENNKSRRITTNFGFTSNSFVRELYTCYIAL
ncbi:MULTISPECIES: hypothetical protein [Chryseobacterium]|uniref:hypothetical protein n=1 Tax=Chryseobacterium TaxID=59732 RepID=UPI001627BF0F|nr:MULTISPECIES: hypothetical protein [Chryseobacterium]MDM1555199.1 hypothetical protein [Chryseobacterium indologenes]